MEKQREITLKIIDKVLEMANAISIQLNKEIRSSKINSFEAVISMLHKRIHSNVISIRAFVNDEKNLSPIAPSILYRAVALDYMHLLYLKILKLRYEGNSYKWKGTISEEFQNEINNLLNDQLVRLYRDGYEMIGVEFETEKEYLDWVEGVKLNLPKEYHHITKDTKGFDYPNPTKLFRILKSNLPSDEFNNNLKKIWSFYSMYSKIDHFGIVSVMLERKSLDHFIKELRLAMLFVHDAVSIVGVEFMQVESFAKMWIDASDYLAKVEDDSFAVGIEVESPQRGTSEDLERKAR